MCAYARQYNVQHQSRVSSSSTPKQNSALLVPRAQ